MASALPPGVEKSSRAGAPRSRKPACLRGAIQVARDACRGTDHLCGASRWLPHGDWPNALEAHLRERKTDGLASFIARLCGPMAGTAEPMEFPECSSRTPAVNSCVASWLQARSRVYSRRPKENPAADAQRRGSRPQGPQEIVTIGAARATLRRLPCSGTRVTQRPVLWAGVVQDSSRGFRGRALETRSPAGFLRPAAPKRSASNWNWKRRKGRLARSVLTSSARTSTPSTGWVAPYLECRVRVSQSRRGPK